MVQIDDRKAHTSWWGRRSALPAGRRLFSAEYLPAKYIPGENAVQNSNK